MLVTWTFRARPAHLSESALAPRVHLSKLECPVIGPWQYPVKGLGFRVKDLMLRAQDLRFSLQDLGLRVV